MHADVRHGGGGRGSHLHLVAPPSRADTLRRWVTPLIPVAAFVVVSCLGLALLASHLHSSDSPFSGIGQGFEHLAQGLEVGGTTADAAEHALAAQPAGSSPAAALSAALPGDEWVDGLTPVPTSSLQRPIVGVTRVGTAVETAVQPTAGVCSFGLAVTSATDPLIGRDGLPGPGTYDQVHDGPCVAAQAPTSSWSTWLGTP